MRAQPFLQFLRDNYDPTQAANLAQNVNIRGGWEVWLQIEIALTFVNLGGNRICDREAPYPSGQVANPWIGNNPAAPPAYIPVANPGIRCDFHLHHPAGIGLQDDTYVELKCINPNAVNPLNDAWQRYNDDIDKIRNIEAINPILPGIAVLATYGQFNGPLPQFPHGVNAYVWDPTNNVVTTMNNVTQGGANRFFMVAASV
jgi:hypothetical protein